MKETLVFLWTYYGIYLYFACFLFGCYNEKFLKKDSNINHIFLSVFLGYGYSIVLSHLPVHTGVKFLCAYAGGRLAPGLCHFVLQIIKNIMSSAFFNKYKYGLGIFTFFVLYSLFNMPRKVDWWVHVWFASDYSFGIGPRFFVGALVNLISPNALSTDPEKVMIIFIACSFLLLAGVISFCLNKLILTSELKYRDTIILLIIFYIASPFCITAYFERTIFGKLEMHCFLLMLVAIISFLIIKNKILKYGVVTIISCIAMAVYQGYIFLYYPFVVLVMLLNILSSTEKVNKGDLIGSVVSVLVTAISFLYFQFFSYVNFDSAASFCNALKLKVGWRPYCRPAYYELFASISQRHQFTIPFLKQNARELLYFALLILSPFIVYFYHFSRIIWKYRNRNGIFHNQYLYCFLAFLSFLPQFILNKDWGRWLVALGNLAFFEVFILIYFQDKGALSFLQKLDDFVKKHYLFCLVLIIYFSKLRGFTYHKLLDAANIYSMLFN